MIDNSLNSDNPLSKYTLEEQQEINELIEKGFGMFKITKENAPKGSLFNFDVGEHITLFDEQD